MLLSSSIDCGVTCDVRWALADHELVREREFMPDRCNWSARML